MTQAPYDPADIQAGRIAIDHGLIDRELARRCLDSAQASGVTFVEAARQLGALTESRLGILTQLIHEVTLGPSQAPLGASLQSAVSQLPQVGDGLNGYRLTRLLGQGGMGAVFLGEREGQQVAIKVILGEVAPSEAMRFEREAQAAARVGQHPNIVAIHSAGQAAGRPYLIFDFVEGCGLDRRLEAGEPIEVEEAVALVTRVAEALAFTHEQGLIHRDLKPANILIRADGQPLVTDFGLARGEGFETLTRTGEVMGTPAYMAPEQVEGVRATPATDVWALGVLLFELLTGERPFTGAGAAQVCTAIIARDHADPRSLGVPEGLSRIIDSCLQKDPTERYPSARELADALAAWSRGEVVAQLGVTRRGRLARGLLRIALILALGASIVWAAVVLIRRGGAPARDAGRHIEALRRVRSRLAWAVFEVPGQVRPVTDDAFQELSEVVSEARAAGIGSRADERAEIVATFEFKRALEAPDNLTWTPSAPSVEALRSLLVEPREREEVIARLRGLSEERDRDLSRLLWLVAARELRCWSELHAAAPWRGELEDSRHVAAMRQVVAVAAWEDPDDARFLRLLAAAGDAADDVSAAFEAARPRETTSLALLTVLDRLGPRIDLEETSLKGERVAAAISWARNIAGDGPVPTWEQLRECQDALGSVGVELIAPDSRPWKDFQPLASQVVFLPDDTERLNDIIRLLRFGVVPYGALEVGITGEADLGRVVGDRQRRFLPYLASTLRLWATDEREESVNASGESSRLIDEAEAFEASRQGLEALSRDPLVTPVVRALCAFQGAKFRDSSLRLRHIASAIASANAETNRELRVEVVEQARRSLYSNNENMAELLGDLDIVLRGHFPMLTKFWRWFEHVTNMTTDAKKGEWALHAASLPLSAETPDAALLEAASAILGVAEEELQHLIEGRGERWGLTQCWVAYERERALALALSGARPAPRPPIAPLFFYEERLPEERAQLAAKWIDALRSLGRQRASLDFARAVQRQVDWRPPYSGVSERLASEWRLCCEFAPLGGIDLSALREQLPRAASVADATELLEGGLALLLRLDEAGATALVERWREELRERIASAPGGRARAAEVDRAIVAARQGRAQSWGAFAYGAAWLEDAEASPEWRAARDAVKSALKALRDVAPREEAWLVRALTDPRALLDGSGSDALAALIDGVEDADFGRLKTLALPPGASLARPPTPGSGSAGPLSTLPGARVLAAAVARGELGVLQAWAGQQLGAGPRVVPEAVRALASGAEGASAKAGIDRAILVLARAALQDGRAGDQERCEVAERALSAAERLGEPREEWAAALARSLAVQLIAAKGQEAGLQRLRGDEELRACVWEDASVALNLIGVLSSLGERELAAELASRSPLTRRHEPEVVAALAR